VNAPGRLLLRIEVDSAGRATAVREPPLEKQVKTITIHRPGQGKIQCSSRRLMQRAAVLKIQPLEPWEILPPAGIDMEICFGGGRRIGQSETGRTGASRGTRM